VFMFFNGGIRALLLSGAVGRAGTLHLGRLASCQLQNSRLPLSRITRDPALRQGRLDLLCRLVRREGAGPLGTLR
jgi:hypothetical protein